MRVLDTLPDFRNENPTLQHKVKSGAHPAAIAGLPPEGSRRRDLVCVGNVKDEAPAGNQ